MATRNLRDGQLTLKDAGANEVIVALAKGDLSWDEESEGNVIEILDRGTLDHMRKGDEVSVKGSFGTKFVEFVGTSSASPDEAIHFRGAAVAWATTNTDGGDVKTLDMEFLVTNPATGNNELVTFSRVTFKKHVSEGDEYNELNYDFMAFQTAADYAKQAQSS